LKTCFERPSTMSSSRVGPVPSRTAASGTTHRIDKSTLKWNPHLFNGGHEAIGLGALIMFS
jgi:hypothetical protein